MEMRNTSKIKKNLRPCLLIRQQDILDNITDISKKEEELSIHDNRNIKQTNNIYLGEIEFDDTVARIIINNG